MTTDPKEAAISRLANDIDRRWNSPEGVNFEGSVYVFAARIAIEQGVDPVSWAVHQAVFDQMANTHRAMHPDCNHCSWALTTIPWDAVCAEAETPDYGPYNEPGKPADAQQGEK